MLMHRYFPNNLPYLPHSYRKLFIADCRNLPRRCAVPPKFTTCTTTTTLAVCAARLLVLKGLLIGPPARYNRAVVHLQVVK